MFEDFSCRMSFHYGLQEEQSERERRVMRREIQELQNTISLDDVVSSHKNVLSPSHSFLSLYSSVCVVR